jgi:beta-D-xylosidase 4
MKLVALVTFIHGCLSMASLSNPCDSSPIRETPFCDYSLSALTRAKDLVVNQLTVAEVVSQLGTTSPGIPRLAIPARQWWSEGLHGLADSPGVSFAPPTGSATQFPSPIALASGFNRTAVRLMARAVATEARAFYGVGHAGLSLFTPNINLVRDPRWGRAMETPGEDPLVSGRYAEDVVLGLQGMPFRPSDRSSAGFLTAIATIKHFAAYDMEGFCYDGACVDRFHFNAEVSQAGWEAHFLPMFTAGIKAGAGSLMCSYNAINGVPSCASPQLRSLRPGFQGYVVSDCGAIDAIQYSHNYTKTTSQTVEAALSAGTDLDCGSFYQKHAAGAANVSGLARESAMRLFAARIRLGEFDPVAARPSAPLSSINSPEHRALALETARQGLVLLKNENLLPLWYLSSIALIGPHANATTAMLGNYFGVAPEIVSPLEGFERYVPEVTLARGCADVRCESDELFAEAEKAASDADVAVLVLGIDGTIENEGLDRTSLALPGLQNELCMRVRKAVRGALVVVVMSGGPVDLGPCSEFAQALIWTGYPGQMGGAAIADAVMQAGNFSPVGRLPFTIYPANYTLEQPSMFNMSFQSGPGRTYMYYDNPVYPFGYGLSYVNFDYAIFSGPGASQIIQVTNTDAIRAAGQAVLLAVEPFPREPGDPIRILADYGSVFLQPGESKNLTLTPVILSKRSHRLVRL